ncbi:MAG: Fmu (Sun) domain-containing protein [Terrimonas sp.]|nr:Fmu (Sun) domain-containing protein [Terrimonas sp.]
MKFIHSYISHALAILKAYNGEMPLASFLKKYFSRSRKFGSHDRKQIAQLCYAYFRLGKSAIGMDRQEALLTGFFLSSSGDAEIIEVLKPEWHSLTGQSLAKKIAYLQYPVDKVFPWQNALSDHIDYEAFSLSFFRQPDLFLRIRPGHLQSVKRQLDSSGLDYAITDAACIRLSNSVKADKLFVINREVVIQDLNSQQTGDIIAGYLSGKTGTTLQLWDCCAASGGKSIMLYDRVPGLALHVSDIRESILANLRQRFREAGIDQYDLFPADLSKEVVLKNKLPFDIILADVPCSGSGTWSRTPEQTYFFEEKKIDVYQGLQKRIVSHAIPYLRKGGLFIYITCSVFRKENEEMVRFIQEEKGLQLLKMEILKGYDQQADTLFIALFNS